MEWTAVFAAVIARALFDPLTWALIVVSLAFGARRASTWVPLGVAAVFALLHAAFVFRWWQEIGVSDSWLQRLAVFVVPAKIFWAYAGFAIGRIGARMLNAVGSAGNGPELGARTPAQSGQQVQRPQNVVLKLVLGTVGGRLLLLLGVGLIAGLNLYAANRIDHITDPTVWYFWTDTFLFGSTPTPARVAKTFLPSRSAWTIERDYREFESRCDDPAKNVMVSARYRGIAFCNSKGLFSGDELDRLHASFHAKVDREFSDYYWELARRHAMATTQAIGAWLIALAIYVLGLWVLAPSRGDQ